MVESSKALLWGENNERKHLGTRFSPKPGKLTETIIPKGLMCDFIESSLSDVKVTVP